MDRIDLLIVAVLFVYGTVAILSWNLARDRGAPRYMRVTAFVACLVTAWYAWRGLRGLLLVLAQD